MNRLTQKIENGTYIVPHEDRYKYGLRDEMIQALGAYEDLGLTPEQIGEVDRLYAEKCREVSELRKSPWIPITERLPEDFDSVLVCDRAGYTDIEWGWYIKDKWWWNNGDDVNCDDIIAWIPLPEPYAESVTE